jgi:hypothetical protein
MSNTFSKGDIVRINTTVEQVNNDWGYVAPDCFGTDLTVVYTKEKDEGLYVYVWCPDVRIHQTVPIRFISLVMAAFKVGDRVTSLARPDTAKETDEAVVVFVHHDDTIVIQFDREFKNAHSGNCHGERNRCWWVEGKDLKPVAPKMFKPTKTFSPKSQCGKLLMTLASGRSITPLEAFGTLGIYRLAARIHELRNAGHKIKAEVRYDEQGKSYARYTLKSRKFV